MKTPFTKNNLKKRGQYLMLDTGGSYESFIARFKYSGPISMSIFKKELIKNHTVEDYLNTVNNPDYSLRKAPLEVLKEKNPTWYKEEQNKWLLKQRKKSVYEIF